MTQTRRNRWVVGPAAAFAYAVVIAVPTDLIDTPVFGREIPPTWWSWPALLVSAALVGLIAATYVQGTEPLAASPSENRRGVAGGLLTYFAVGCPVCNKLVLLALGSSGALTWFEPVQPVLQLAGIGLLAWALRQRLGSRRACRLTPNLAPATASPPPPPAATARDRASAATTRARP